MRGLICGLALVLAGCGGGGAPSSPVVTPTPTPSPTPSPTPVPSLYARPALEALSASEVEGVIARAAGEARARNLPAVIAVVDRVGNVLAVFAMAGARGMATARAGIGSNVDVQGVVFPAALGAISKALTGAYLSSGGNAFSTRTASMIVQEHFPPSRATVGLESGPLSGVQFSQLPCSDVMARLGAAGPKRAPLGLAADPGGMPLYRNGVVVGGVGIMADGDYGFDSEVTDVDDDAEEAIAVAASTGLAAPEAIRAERISVDGTTLRFSDVTALRADPAAAGAFAGVAGALMPVAGFYGGGILAGVAYGSEASGVRAATAAEFAGGDAYVLSDGAGAMRYPVRGGTDAAETLALSAAALSAAEVRALLEEAFAVMGRARAQIRRPLDSRAQVSIAVVDTRGAALGLVRSPDAPMFGIDVAVQKARTAAFFSGRFAAADLLATGDADVAAFVGATNAFFGSPGFLTGAFAVSNRAVGNIARPYFPDGETGRGPGAFSRPIGNFSPFSTGLQSALIVQNLALVLGGGDAAQCTALPATPGAGAGAGAGAGGGKRLANGMQIFPGSVPVYRGAVLVGAIGVSGDGIDQDDMIAFLGAANAGARVGGIGLPPMGIRSDRIVVAVPGSSGVRLRFVGCPFAPFLDTSEQNVCQGR